MNRVTDSHLQEFARRYAAFDKAGLAPTQATAHYFNVSHSTASKWARRARERGLLAPWRMKDYVRMGGLK